MAAGLDGYFAPVSVRISAIADHCFSRIVHGETALAQRRWRCAQGLPGESA